MDVLSPPRSDYSAKNDNFPEIRDFKTQFFKNSAAGHHANYIRSQQIPISSSTHHSNNKEHLHLSHDTRSPPDTSSPWPQSVRENRTMPNKSDFGFDMGFKANLADSLISEYSGHRNYNGKKMEHRAKNHPQVDSFQNQNIAKEYSFEQRYTANVPKSPCTFVQPGLPHDSANSPVNIINDLRQFVQPKEAPITHDKMVPSDLQQGISTTPQISKFNVNKQGPSPAKKVKKEKKEQSIVNGHVFTKKKLLHKEKSKLQLNVNSLEVQSTVQEILNKITSEMKKKGKNDSRNDSISDGKSTPDCCNNCETLGFRHSPQCVNKRTVNEADIFDFNDEEDSFSDLPSFSSRLSKSGLGPHYDKSVNSDTTGFSLSSMVNTATVSTGTGVCSPFNTATVTSHLSSSVMSTNSIVQSQMSSILSSPTPYTSTKSTNKELPSGVFSSLSFSNNSHHLAEFDISEAEKENVHSTSNIMAASSNIKPNLSIKEEIAKSLKVKDEEDVLHGGLDRLAWVTEHVTKLNEELQEDDEHMERLRKNIKAEMPRCGCRGPECK